MKLRTAKKILNCGAWQYPDAMQEHAARVIERHGLPYRRLLRSRKAEAFRAFLQKHLDAKTRILPRVGFGKLLKMQRLAIFALCLLCPSLAVADCESGSCSVADLIARESVAPAGHQPAAAVPVYRTLTGNQANDCPSQKARRRVRCRRTS